MSMDIEKQIERYEEIDKKVGMVSDQVQQTKVRLEYDKKELKEKMELLKEKGIEFNNVSEVEQVMEDTLKELSGILDATERKLNEVDM